MTVTFLYISSLENEYRNAVSSLINWPLQFLSAAVAIGFLTMITVEIVKLPIRRYFNKFKIRRWLRQNYATKELVTKIMDDKRIPDIIRLHPSIRFVEKYNEDQLVNELILLCTVGNKTAFYSLSVENLCGQISVGTQFIIEYPEKYPMLQLALMGKTIEKVDVQNDYVILLSSKPNDNYSNEVAYRDYVESRNRISAYMQRNIDRLQINAAFDWKRIMKATSFFFSIIITFSGSLYFQDTVSGRIILVGGIFLAYIATFFASFIRDIISVIEKYKK